ncbi:MAG TPA: hypothetical protein VMT03_12810 [Polyangia bacterium]|nr:hypothetical protein [Polyangia bacterium]
MAKQFVEQWSGITPHDLGLKAAYWSGKEDDPVVYRPVVGWMTVTGRATDAPPNTPLANQFFPLVLGDDWWPHSAWELTNYGGVVPKDIADDAVKEAIKKWRTKPEGPDVQVNVRTVGQA